MALDLERIRREGVYQANLPRVAMLAELEQISSLAKAAAAQRKTLRIASALCLLGGIVLIIAGVDAAAPASIIVFCVCLFIYSFLYQRDLNDYGARLNLLRDALDVFREETNASAPIKLQLALKAKPKLVSEAPFPQRKNGKQKLFEEEVLTAECPLLDGTTASQTITELVRERTYTNPRGKRRSKKRVRHIVALRLAYAAKTYGDIRPVASGLRPEIKVPTTALVRDLRITEKAISLKALVRSTPDLKQTIAMLALGGYRILNLSRQVARKRGQA